MAKLRVGISGLHEPGAPFFFFLGGGAGCYRDAERSAVKGGVKMRSSQPLITT